MAAALASMLATRDTSDNAFLLVESVMGFFAALGGPPALTTVASAMSTGRNQFRLMSLFEVIQWVKATKSASWTDKVKARSIFLFYFCDVGCYLASAAPGAVISESTAAAAGKYSLFTWGTYVVLAVITNFKAMKAAKRGSPAYTKAKWEFIRQALWLICIINWVVFEGARISPLQMSIITAVISGSSLWGKYVETKQADKKTHVD